MSLAAGLFFITPALQRRDVAFQGLNTWYCFQYLAAVIYLNRHRQAYGHDRLRHGRPLRVPRLGMYAVGSGLTAACGVLYIP